MAEPTIITTASVQTVRSENFRSVYVNHAIGGATNWDVHLTFSALVEQEPSKPVIEEQIMVMMTCEFAKALADTLAATISAYENKPTLMQPNAKPEVSESK